MDLALIRRNKGGGGFVVNTTFLGTKGSYRNYGIYGDPGDAAHALHEFQSTFPGEHYLLVDARKVAHQQKEVFKWEIFPEYTYPEGYK